ncbi:hypothetical protein [Methylobacterium longum]|uniref:Uncharacterized protein n=1 Tax=Methylobacterium longum TaxID=767694 RepID=A0ABT8B0L1_9HYPH|nr:hypothetical protein [Methylobacterium longum]MDN3575053.1 hypothetical protein [Methylobacterium longum]GJE15169.1 hypothetical protein FOHLNKBM_6247 [Methylobacterium longum]
MVSDPEASDIEVEANQSFEVVWSRVQLVLQWLIGIIVCAGLLGVFGDGWLSTTTRAFPSVPLSITYQRLLRANAPSDLTLAITGRLPGEALELSVGSELLDRGSIGSTQPGAADVSTTAQGVTYRFRLGPDHAGHVMLKLSLRQPGPVDMVLTANGERLALPLFVYP